MGQLLTAEVIRNLENEWLWMLMAAETWRWIKNHPDETEPRPPYAQRVFPPHLVVLALDAAFLHGRNLYEFFGMKGTGHISPHPDPGQSARASWFGFPTQTSMWWDEWERALHKRLFHIEADRSSKGAKSDTTPDKAHNINEQALYMVQDLHQLWDSLVGATSVNRAVRERLGALRTQAMKRTESLRRWFEGHSEGFRPPPALQDPLATR
jgi:hypothetical protein